MHNLKDLVVSYSGTLGTIILGQITISTASAIYAFLMVIVATLTAILTILKIVEWCHRWKNRHKKPLNPSQYEKED